MTKLIKVIDKQPADDKGVPNAPIVEGKPVYDNKPVMEATGPLDDSQPEDVPPSAGKGRSPYDVRFPPMPPEDASSEEDIEEVYLPPAGSVQPPAYDSQSQSHEKMAAATPVEASLKQPSRKYLWGAALGGAMIGATGAITGFVLSENYFDWPFQKATSYTPPVTPTPDKPGSVTEDVYFNDMGLHFDSPLGNVSLENGVPGDWFIAEYNQSDYADLVNKSATGIPARIGHDGSVVTEAKKVPGGNFVFEKIGYDAVQAEKVLAKHSHELFPGVMAGTDIDLYFHDFSLLDNKEHKSPGAFTEKFIDTSEMKDVLDKLIGNGVQNVMQSNNANAYSDGILSYGFAKVNGTPVLQGIFNYTVNGQNTSVPVNENSIVALEGGQHFRDKYYESLLNDFLMGEQNHAADIQGRFDNINDNQTKFLQRFNFNNLTDAASALDELYSALNQSGLLVNGTLNQSALKENRTNSDRFTDIISKYGGHNVTNESTLIDYISGLEGIIKEERDFLARYEVDGLDTLGVMIDGLKIDHDALGRVFSKYNVSDEQDLYDYVEELEHSKGINQAPFNVDAFHAAYNESTGVFMFKEREAQTQENLTGFALNWTNANVKQKFRNMNVSGAKDIADIFDKKGVVRVDIQDAFDVGDSSAVLVSYVQSGDRLTVKDYYELTETEWQNAKSSFQ